MNKNFKVFQIHGLTGLFFICFIAICLCIGFLIVPVWAVMAGWNQIITPFFELPSINYIQAALLWSIVVITFYIIFRNSVSIHIHTSDKEINDFEIKDIIHEIEENRAEETR
jgi:hypothetical protein